MAFQMVSTSRRVLVPLQTDDASDRVLCSHHSEQGRYNIVLYRTESRRYFYDLVWIIGSYGLA